MFGAAPDHHDVTTCAERIDREEGRRGVSLLRQGGAPRPTATGGAPTRGFDMWPIYKGPTTRGSTKAAPLLLLCAAAVEEFLGLGSPHGPANPPVCS
jgi:hypothetical protein